MKNDELWEKLLKIDDFDDDNDEEFKSLLINGYKICKNKTYDFLKTMDDEYKYFSREDISPDEEAYYFFVLRIPKRITNIKFVKIKIIILFEF